MQAGYHGSLPSFAARAAVQLPRHHGAPVTSLGQDTHPQETGAKEFTPFSQLTGESWFIIIIPSPNQQTTSCIVICEMEIQRFLSLFAWKWLEPWTLKGRCSLLHHKIWLMKPPRQDCTWWTVSGRGVKTVSLLLLTIACTRFYWKVYSCIWHIGHGGNIIWLVRCLRNAHFKLVILKTNYWG